MESRDGLNTSPENRRRQSRSARYFFTSVAKRVAPPMGSVLFGGMRLWQSLKCSSTRSGAGLEADPLWGARGQGVEEFQTNA